MGKEWQKHIIHVCNHFSVAVIQWIRREKWKWIGHTLRKLCDNVVRSSKEDLKITGGSQLNKNCVKDKVTLEWHGLSSPAWHGLPSPGSGWVEEDCRYPSMLYWGERGIVIQIWWHLEMRPGGRHKGNPTGHTWNSLEKIAHNRVWWRAVCSLRSVGPW